MIKCQLCSLHCAALLVFQHVCLVRFVLYLLDFTLTCCTNKMINQSPTSDEIKVSFLNNLNMFVPFFSACFFFVFSFADTYRCSVVQGTSRSVVFSEFQESTDRCQSQQGLEEVVKQDASLTQKSHGSSSARSGRAKLKPERTGTRRSQRLAACRASEPSPNPS